MLTKQQLAALATGGNHSNQPKSEQKKKHTKIINKHRKYSK